MVGFTTDNPGLLVLTGEPHREAQAPGPHQVACVVCSPERHRGPGEIAARELVPEVDVALDQAARPCPAVSVRCGFKAHETLKERAARERAAGIPAVRSLVSNLGFCDRSLALHQ